ncbi:MAG: LuxR C-terminal-related transcriptional regulator [Hyphomicrobiales bacterium]
MIQNKKKIHNSIDPLKAIIDNPELPVSTRRRAQILYDLRILKLSAIEASRKNNVTRQAIYGILKRFRNTSVETYTYDELILKLSDRFRPGRPKKKKTNINTIIELTPREKEVLLWIAAGKSNSIIAELLGISTSTVNYHVKQIFRKLEVYERTLAVVKAIRLGIIEV